jgi:prevent-host-death family protein
MPATLKREPVKPARRGVRKSRVASTPPLPSVVNVHEAKTQLSRLLARVEAGEEITIARAGQPFARLVPLATAAPLLSRMPGRFKGMFGSLTDAEAMAPLPPEFSGLIPSPTDPLSRP